MKRIMSHTGLFTMLLAGALSACESNGKAPQKVLHAFQERFPKAVSVRWDQEEAGEWEAEFKQERIAYSANFREDGTWLETEYEVVWPSLPTAVKEGYRTEFKGIEPEEIERAERPDGTYYEFALEQQGKDWIILFDSKGQAVSRQADNTED